jgi:1-acyl-sn-glycerol-3-phosphate acyltransferase
MRKKIIIAGYIVLFWIVIPFLLIYSSIILKKELAPLYLQKGLPLVPGVILLSISVPLLLISVWQFSKYCGELPVSAYPPKMIIRRGLYNYWRHPIYLFVILTFTGVSFVLRSRPMLLIVMPLFILMTFIYTTMEERILRRRYGKSYSFYMRITGLIFPVLYQVLRYPAILVMKLIFRYKIKNAGKIPVSPPYFIVALHRNYLDPFFIAAGVQHPISYLSTFETYRSGFMRRCMNMAFGIPRKRFRPDPSSARKLIETLECGGVIGLFPEGERSWTGETLRFKPEVIKLLLKYNEIPILPVKIHGSYHTWPRWAEGMRRYRITVEFMDPFTSSVEVKPQELENLMVEKISCYAPPVILTKGKLNFASGLEKVIYRCPECGDFNSLEEKESFLKCKKCSLRIDATRDLRLNIKSNRISGQYSIRDCYNTIKVTDHDLLFSHMDDWIKPFSLNDSGRCILYAENGVHFVRFIEGELLLEPDCLLFTAGNQKKRIDYAGIGSVTTESNYKLQIFDKRENQLFKVEFRNSSVLQWQDIITSAIFITTGRRINTT